MDFTICRAWINVSTSSRFGWTEMTSNKCLKNFMPSVSHHATVFWMSHISWPRIPPISCKFHTKHRVNDYNELRTCSQNHGAHNQGVWRSHIHRCCAFFSNPRVAELGPSRWRWHNVHHLSQIRMWYLLCVLSEHRKVWGKHPKIADP